jgi:hypothetical protein
MRYVEKNMEGMRMRQRRGEHRKNRCSQILIQRSPAYKIRRFFYFQFFFQML